MCIRDRFLSGHRKTLRPDYINLDSLKSHGVRLAKREQRKLRAMSLRSALPFKKPEGNLRKCGVTRRAETEDKSADGMLGTSRFLKSCP